ncbi:MAG: D-aminoacylase [Kiritimatiellaeota bacterium]|nr:D-aminoacylase [Kiritimatiellota bacterium]
MFDLIITNGNVIDGTGAVSRRVDVGITGDRVTALGDLSAAETSVTLDAQGLIVAPGFIDAHAHSDTYLLIEPDAPSKLAQGITTEVNGQCGGSAAPRLGKAKLPSDWASRLGAKGPAWATMAEYRVLFESVRPAINTVQFVGHNTLRAGVMGYEPREATADEIAEMNRRLEQALDEGGWGLSTGLLYQPGKYATEAEVETLAQTTVRKGGMYASHIRNEGDTLLESVDEVLRLARATGIQVQISHLKTASPANWHKIDALLTAINAARAEGLNVNADRYPYTAGGTDLDVVLPDWASAGGRDAILANLRDSATRLRIEREMDARGYDWANVMLGGGWTAETRAHSGQTVPEAARALGLTPAQLTCRFIDLDDTRTGAFFFGMSDANLLRIYAEPWVMPGSDASLRAPWGVLGDDHPHPRAYGTMPRFLRLMTADGHSIEETIRRMTALPAATFGLRDRGVLCQGAFADIAIFDPAAFRDTATYAKPHSFAEGMRHVIVNGALSYTHGAFTGNRGGRFLGGRE